MTEGYEVTCLTHLFDVFVDARTKYYLLCLGDYLALKYPGKNIDALTAIHMHIANKIGQPLASVSYYSIDQLAEHVSEELEVWDEAWKKVANQVWNEKHVSLPVKEDV